MAQVSKPVVISAGTSQSGLEFLDQGGLIVGLLLPAAWDAANVTFLHALDPNAAFSPVFDRNGQEYVVVVAAGRVVTIPNIDLSALRYFKVRSGTSQIPIPQTADRIIQVMITGR